MSYSDATTYLYRLFDRLTAENKNLRIQPRCPCGGELEGLGYDKETHDTVYQCKKCPAQLLIEHSPKEEKPNKKKGVSPTGASMLQI